MKFHVLVPRVAGLTVGVGPFTSRHEADIYATRMGMHRDEYRVTLVMAPKLTPSELTQRMRMSPPEREDH